MNVASRVSDWRPEPPTPRSSTLPLGWRMTRVMRATWEMASMNMTRCMGCFESWLYSVRYSSIVGWSCAMSLTSS